MESYTFIIQLVIMYISSSSLRANPLAGENVKKVTQNDLQYVVSIAYRERSPERKNNHLCCGILISPRNVLTIERCLIGKEIQDLVIYIGSSDIRGSREYFPKRWITYNSWIRTSKSGSPPVLSTDIAVVKLNREVVLKNLKPASMFWATYNEFKGNRLTVSGWGQLKDDTRSAYLKKASVHVLDQSECKDITSRLVIGAEKLICTSAIPHVITKPGDFGGPLVDIYRRVIGISYGVLFKELNNPSSATNVHLNVAYYRKFIEYFMKS
ncbi:hypothetical protein QAD02_006199 [Eretmocerus hayati]|uniref:Uncharacterized protein n=1 Tax=Eretmocerus hayati TaxID=131215 RepID=A0ACC2N0L1_9HYME|nr:hypothetical protein QAD02_006199 [Eretmocerus hayati]